MRDLQLRNFNENGRRNCAVKPLAYGSWFHLGLAHFDVISILNKSTDHGKLLSICSIQNDQIPSHRHGQGPNKGIRGLTLILRLAAASISYGGPPRPVVYHS